MYWPCALLWVYLNELLRWISATLSCGCQTQGQGLDKAMTASEAMAFVGDKQCIVTVLNEEKLFLEAPSSPPTSRTRRQRRDTSSENMDLMVSCGFHSSVHDFTSFFLSTISTPCPPLTDKVWPWRVDSRHRALWEEEWGSTIHHHPSGDSSHAAVHSCFCVLL